MTKIILVRHGHVEGISPERFRGRADLQLTAEGRHQAEATARRIHASWTPAAIYTSPLSRCRTTGAAIAKPFGLSPQSVERLIDIDYGEWQGLTPQQVEGRWPEQLDTWYRAPHLSAIPAGETLQEVLTRTSSVLREVLGRHPTDTVVVVGHDSVNRVMLLHALDLSLSRYWQIAQAPCAINEIDASVRDFRVLSVNETYHLTQLD
jgi:phosphoserine phosphatase